MAEIKLKAGDVRRIVVKTSETGAAIAVYDEAKGPPATTAQMTPDEVRRLIVALLTK